MSKVEGEIVARVASLSVVDKDGDVILPGAINGSQPVMISGFGHSAMRHGAIPVGAGTIVERGGAIILEGKYFLDIEPGLIAFRVVKALQDAGVPTEWSFGYDVVTRSEPNEDQRRAGAWRVINKMIVREVSPVVFGAGIQVETLSAKHEQRAIEAELEKLKAISRRFRAASAARTDTEAAAEFRRFIRTSRLFIAATRR